MLPDSTDTFNGQTSHRSLNETPHRDLLIIPMPSLSGP